MSILHKRQNWEPIHEADVTVYFTRTGENGIHINIVYRTYRFEHIVAKISVNGVEKHIYKFPVTKDGKCIGMIYVISINMSIDDLKRLIISPLIHSEDEVKHNIRDVESLRFIIKCDEILQRYDSKQKSEILVGYTEDRFYGEEEYTKVPCDFFDKIHRYKFSIMKDISRGGLLYYV